MKISFSSLQTFRRLRDIGWVNKKFVWCLTCVWALAKFLKSLKCYWLSISKQWTLERWKLSRIWRTFSVFPAKSFLGTSFHIHELKRYSNICTNPEFFSRLISHSNRTLSSIFGSTSKRTKWNGGRNQRSVRGRRWSYDGIAWETSVYGTSH